jgi:hypothetical protein
VRLFGQMGYVEGWLTAAQRVATGALFLRHAGEEDLVKGGRDAGTK